MKTRKKLYFWFSFLMVFQVACGSWLGNPSDFDKDSPKQSENVPVYISLIGVNNKQVTTVNKSGVADAVDIDSLNLNLTNVSFGDQDIQKEDTLDLSNGLSQIGELSRSTKVKEIKLTWGANSFSLSGRYKSKELVLPLDLQSLATSIVLSKEIELTKPLHIQINLQKVLDFTNETIDLDSFESLDFSQNDTPERESFLQSISSRVNSNVSSGVDEDEDGDVDEEDEEAEDEDGVEDADNEEDADNGEDPDNGEDADNGSDEDNGAEDEEEADD